MRKRITAFILSASLVCLPYVSQAKTAVFGNISADGTIKISLSSDNGQSIYGIHILKPGQTIGDVNQITSGSSTAFAGFETMSLANQKGEFQNTEKIFTLPNGAEEGVYTLVIGGGELAGKEIKVVFDDGYPQAATEAKNAQDLESVLVQYQDKAWSLDFKNSSYLSSKAVVLENMENILKNADATSEAVTEAFNQACILAELRNCSTGDIAENLLVYEKYLGLNYSEIVKTSPEKIEKTFANLRVDESMKTPTELNRLVKASNALTLLNVATRDEVIGVLSNNNDIFELDFNGDYKKVDPYDVAKKIVPGDDPYTSLADVRSSFKNAISEIISSEKEENKKPSGGGGGGGGGGTSFIAPPAMQETVVTSDKLAQQDTKELFNDLDSAEWAIPYIKYLSENKIMQGDGKGNFRPNDGILREEFLKLIIEAFGVESVSETKITFIDVEDGAWYKDYVATGVEYGLINGISEDQFGVGMYISREDAAVMIKRAADSLNIQLTEKTEEIAFVDKDAISDYAVDAVSLLSKAQIINGYETGEFAPKKSILRSEAAKIIYSTIKAME